MDCFIGENDMKRKMFLFYLRLLTTYFVVIGLLLIPSILSGQETTKLKLTSPVFENMGDIPMKYSCDGGNVSPPLFWEGVPDGCVAMAIIMEDPDAPVKTMIHWMIWNIDPKFNGLEEDALAGVIGAFSSKNDFDKYGYSGPCLKSGSHVYQFKLYALSEKIDLKSDATKSDLLAAMSGKTLATSTLFGTYTKLKKTEP